MPDYAAAHHAINLLRSPAYLRDVAKLPQEKQLIKQRLPDAFTAMVELYRQGDLPRLNALSQQILALAPEHPEAWLVMGLLHLDLFDNPKNAIQLLEAYLKRNARNAAALASLSIAHFRADDWNAAQKAAKTALAVNPKNTLAHSSLAQIAYAQGDYKQALTHTRGGLKADPGDIQLLTNHGGLLQILGHRDQAETFYRETLESYPQFFNGYYALTEILRFGDVEDPLIKQARELADTLPEQTPDIGTLYFALGRMYLQCGHDEKAWNFLHKAKEAALRTSHSDPAQWSKLGERVSHFFTPAYFAREDLPQAKPHPKITPVFIIGMPRSGTTLIEQILASHSRIGTRGEMRMLEMLSRQIPGGYPEGLAGADEKQLQQFADRYYAELQRGVPEGKRLIIDKLPYNFFRLGLITQLFPQAKIIHCARDPMDTCLSIYSARFAAMPDWSLSLERIADYMANYRRLMHHWEEALPLPIYRVDYEEITSNPQREAQKLLDFLEVSWEDACLQFHRSRRAVATASAWQVRQPIHTRSIDRWRRHEEALQPFIDHYKATAE